MTSTKSFDGAGEIESLGFALLRVWEPRSQNGPRFPTDRQTFVSITTAKNEKMIRNWIRLKTFFMQLWNEGIYLLFSHIESTSFLFFGFSSLAEQ
jgi:hypothetical protein